jgi:uncharacterized protein YbjT (DUF2867 family)
MILVAGGTGFIGRAIVTALRREGHQIRVLTRGGRSNPFVADRGVTLVEGDVREPGTLAAAMEGVETVVCAVQFPGHPVERKRKGLTYDEYDRQGTQNLVAAATKAGVKRFVYISGAGVGEGRPEEWFVAKDAAEKAVRESGLTYTILRPSWVYGPRDRSLGKFAMLARLLPVVPLPGPGKAKVRPIHVEDVGAAVALAVAGGPAEDQVIPLGGPQLLSIRQIVRVMLEVMGKRRLVLPAPTFAVKLGSLLLYRMPGHLLSPRAVDFVNADGDVDVVPQRDLLGLRPRALADGIGYLR